MSTIENVFQAIDLADDQSYELFYPRYLELLAAMADGDETDPEEARHVLQAMGKSRGDVESDLQLFTKRRRALESLSGTTEADLNSERMDLECSLQKLEERFQKAESKFKADRAELQAKLDNVSHRSGARFSLVSLMKNQPLNRALSADLKKVNSELGELFERRRHKVRFRMETLSLIESIKSNYGDDLPPRVADSVREQQAIVDRIDSEMKEIDQASRDLQLRQEELGERLLSEI